MKIRQCNGVPDIHAQLTGGKLEGCSGSKLEGDSGLAVNLKVTLIVKLKVPCYH